MSGPGTKKGHEWHRLETEHPEVQRVPHTGPTLNPPLSLSQQGCPGLSRRERAGRVRPQQGARSHQEAQEGRGGPRASSSPCSWTGLGHPAQKGLQEEEGRGGVAGFRLSLHLSLPRRPAQTSRGSGHLSPSSRQSRKHPCTADLGEAESLAPGGPLLVLYTAPLLLALILPHTLFPGATTPILGASPCLGPGDRRRPRLLGPQRSSCL